MRKKKRLSALKSQLLDEAKKEKYRNEVKKHIRLLQEKQSYHHERAVEARHKQEREELELAIKNSRFLQNHLDKLKNILKYLDDLSVSSDMKLVYDQFVQYLNEFSYDSDKKKKKRRGLKKILKIHRKETSEVQDYFELVDKRIRKITKESADVVSDNKPLTDKEIDVYFDRS